VLDLRRAVQHPARHAPREHRRLSRAGAGEQAQWSVVCCDRGALGVGQAPKEPIEPVIVSRTNQRGRLFEGAGHASDRTGGVFRERGWCCSRRWAGEAAGP
jgi:hypothetical protein